MTRLEHKITQSFTIDHAKMTLTDICEKINEVWNEPETSDEDKKKLDGVHRYLSNAINQINEAKDYLQ